jgi:hypothetical protein
MKRKKLWTGDFDTVLSSDEEHYLCTVQSRYSNGEFMLKLYKMYFLDEDSSLRTIAESIGKSRERVRQQLYKAIRIVKKYRERKLRKYPFDELSVRAQNCIKNYSWNCGEWIPGRQQITTIEELLHIYQHDELEGIKNLGRHTKQEIKEFLRVYFPEEVDYAYCKVCNSKYKRR